MSVAGARAACWYTSARATHVARSRAEFPLMIANRSHIGIAMALMAMLCFACMDTLSKWLVADFPILQLMWARAIAFTLLTVALLGRSGLRNALRSRRPALQAGVAFLLLFEGAVFVLALHYLPLADAHALGAVAPLMVIAMSATLLGERIGVARWIAVAAGFAGVLVILRPGFQEFSVALLIPPACALMWAGYQILSRFCSQADGPDTTMAWTAFVGLLATTATIPWNWVWPDAVSGALMAGCAILGAAALFFLIKALDFAKASTIQPFNNSALVWASLLGFLVFGQFPDFWTIVGAGIIVAAALFAWYLDTVGTITPQAAVLPAPGA
jgi:drug/metabolite transporter (DMT)-like permease